MVNVCEIVPFDEVTVLAVPLLSMMPALNLWLLSELARIN